MSITERTPFDYLTRVPVRRIAAVGAAASMFVGCSAGASPSGGKTDGQIASTSTIEQGGPIIVLDGAVRNPDDGDTAVRPIAVDRTTGSASCSDSQVGEQMSGDYILHTSNSDGTTEVFTPASNADYISVKGIGGMAYVCLGIKDHIGPNYIETDNGNILSFATRTPTGSKREAGAWLK